MKATALSPLQPCGTLARKQTLFWLGRFAETQRKSDLLHALYVKRLKRKNYREPSEEDDAVFSGHYLLHKKADELAEHVRNCGGLLFIGSTTVIARAAQEVQTP